MTLVKGRVHQMQKTGLKQLLFMGIIVALLATDQTNLTTTWGTQKTLLAIIASNKAPVVELAKVLATNAKVLSLLAL